MEASVPRKTGLKTIVGSGKAERGPGSVVQHGERIWRRRGGRGRRWAFKTRAVSGARLSRRIRYLACNAFGSAASTPAGKVPTATNPQVDGLGGTGGVRSQFSLTLAEALCLLLLCVGQSEVWRGTREHGEHVGAFS